MLKDILKRVHSSRDLAPLFTALGYKAVDQPYENGGTFVARWRGFKVVATDGKDPRKGARSLARQLATSGQRALAVGVSRSELAIAAPRLGTTGSTKVLVVPLLDPPRAAIQQLGDLRPQGPSTALGHALRVAELLTREGVGERFFMAFRVMVERMAGSLDRRHRSTDRRMVALLALTRVLFLYFVQAKGWLDGRADFLRTLLDTSLGRRRHFHKSALHPLFFGTLNRPPSQRSASTGLGRVPYLNGGLFEPHPVEQRVRPASFSNALWRDAFDGVFERFRFCVRESDEVDAVAPDMLGRVFERLMDRNERVGTGAFYTPEGVVRQVVDAAIETSLSGVGGLLPDLARRLVNREPLTTRETAVAYNALKRLRILDPAAGSGAFLLGALETLAEVRSVLEPVATSRSRCKLRREILRENLFGVDLNPVAVRLAELRLWLAVVADDSTDDVNNVSPLPNLDGVVRQGNTLLDPIGAAASYHPAAMLSATMGEKAVKRARDEFFGARGARRTRAARKLRDAEWRVALNVLSQARKLTEQSLLDLSTVAASRDLFGRRVGLTASQRKRHGALKRTRAELEAAQGALDDSTVPFFSFEVHTPDVLASGGFSAVVGNPPWVRAERLSPALRRTLTHRFTWWKSASGRGYAHHPDLAVAFLQRALELTVPGGAVGLLVPSKIASAGYGEAARSHLVREATVTYLHRVPEKQAVRFGATTYPLAIVLENSPPKPNHAVKLSFDRKQTVRQRSLGAAGPWILVPDRLRDAMERFESSARPVGEIAVPALGVKTGADAILVGTVVRWDGDITRVCFGTQEVRIETRVLRPALRGRDVRPFTADAKRVILWGLDSGGTPTATLPRLATQYVERQVQRLRQRADYRGGPLWTLYRTKTALADNRVVWPDMARRPRAVALDETVAHEAVPLNTCYVAAAPDRETATLIAAVLNSTWATAFAAVISDEARGGYRRINARVVSRMPVPPPSRLSSQLADLSVRAHGGDHVRGVDLDAAVAEALDIPERVQDALRAVASSHI